jgi:hypothetical protein
MPVLLRVLLPERPLARENFPALPREPMNFQARARFAALALTSTAELAPAQPVSTSVVNSSQLKKVPSFAPEHLPRSRRK